MSQAGTVSSHTVTVSGRLHHVQRYMQGQHAGGPQHQLSPI